MMSTTTTTGVTATAPIPPFSSITGQYGVRAYDVTYLQNSYEVPLVWRPPHPGGKCNFGSLQGTAVAPTSLTGWRVIPGG